MTAASDRWQRLPVWRQRTILRVVEAGEMSYREIKLELHIGHDVLVIARRMLDAKHAQAPSSAA